MGTEAVWVPWAIGAAIGGAAISSEQQRKSASKAAANTREAAEAREAARAAEANKTTARTAPGAQLSEAARQNRRKSSAAFQPRGFAPPTLGSPGLLGVTGQGV